MLRFVANRFPTFPTGFQMCPAAPSDMSATSVAAAAEIGNSGDEGSAIVLDFHDDQEGQ
ncbi:MAG: hypothetical protein FD139_3780 [Methylocystaceae bacterium]|nr:MAG: hypothetical protein FD139_3780 [Methylocystaceae bacterium]